MKKIGILVSGIGVMMMTLACAMPNEAWAITQRPESSFKAPRPQDGPTTPERERAERNKSRDGTIRIPDDIRKNTDRLPDWSDEGALDEFLEDSLNPQP